MKIYLDDERQTPAGYTRCFWPEEVIALVFVFTDRKGECFRPLCKKRDNLFHTLEEVHSFIERLSEKKFSPLKRTRSEKEFELFECRVR